MQPAGERALLVAATDTVRGFGRLDQARLDVWEMQAACLFAQA